MDVQVVAIKPFGRPGAFEVTLLIGEAELHFPLTVELVPLGEVEAQLVTAGAAFSKAIHGHIAIDAAIRKLVARQYNSEAVPLPAVVGQIVAPAETVTR